MIFYSCVHTHAYNNIHVWQLYKHNVHNIVIILTYIRGVTAVKKKLVTLVFQVAQFGSYFKCLIVFNRAII